MNPEKTSMSWSHANSWKTRKYLNQGSSFNLRRSVFYPLLCPLTASIGCIIVLLASSVPSLHLLEGSSLRFWTFLGTFKLLQKAEFPILQIVKEERPMKVAQTHQDHIQVGCGLRQSDFFRSLFFFQEVRGKKKKILYFFLFKLGCKSLTQRFNCNDGELQCCTKLFDCSWFKIVRMPWNF